MTDPIAAFHQRIDRIAPMPPADWELLLPHLTTRTLEKGEAFAAIGKRAREAAFVVKGSLRHYYEVGGEERTTYFYFPGDLVCAYVSCLTGQPSELAIEALTGVEPFVFPYARLDELYRTNARWQEFGRKLAEYLAMGLETRMVSLLTRSPEERYADLLASNKHKILEQIPQQYIASYLGITPVSLSRIRKRFAER